MTEGPYLMEKIRTRCVEEGECLLWTGALCAGSTPVVHRNGEYYNLRHFLWERMGNQLPTDGKAVVTKCRDKRCLAEKHLMVDVRSRGGHRWSAAARAKKAAFQQRMSTLSWDDVSEIRISTLPLNELAAKYGKSKRTIQHIRSGETWKVTTGHFAGLGARPEARRS